MKLVIMMLPGNITVGLFKTLKQKKRFTLVEYIECMILFLLSNVFCHILYIEQTSKHVFFFKPDLNDAVELEFIISSIAIEFYLVCCH